MATILIVCVAVFFGGMGLIALASPPWIPAIYGIQVTTPTGQAEIRGVYGGFGLAIAGLLFYAALGDAAALRGGILLSVSMATGGMAVGRGASALIAPAGLHPTWTTFAAEVAMAGALFWAYRLGG